MKILIVDDIEENLYLLESVLTGSGYEVESALNGVIALEKLKDDNFDLIISDILMPVMDGFQLCRKVKADNLLKKIPFVFYTATYTNAKDEEFSLKLGADKFIRKPSDPVDFIEIIQSIFRNIEKDKGKTHKPALKDEKEVFKLYNERLINKLEKKMLDLEKEITERKQAEEELKKYQEQLEKIVKERTKELDEKNKELEAFSYSVSHDLRAPLRAIDGFTRILMEDYVSKLDDEAQRLGTIIQANSQKMGQLIDDLLAFSRIGRASMNFSKIDMKNLVNTIYDEAVNVEERKRITFSIADLPEAFGDTNMLHQVWMNLISNAIKFSSHRKQAVISVTCRVEENKLIYCIKDNGAGFNMKYKDKLFGVFQRLHSEKEFEGTGVGLALVQRIIHRHDGEVWAEGEVDKGAIFYFSLPKEKKSAQL